MKLSDEARRAIGFFAFVLSVVDIPLTLIYMQRMLNGQGSDSNTITLLVVLLGLNGTLLLASYIVALLDVRKNQGISIKEQLQPHLKMALDDAKSLLPIFRWSWRWFYLLCMFSFFNVFKYADNLSDNRIDWIMKQAMFNSGVIVLTITGTNAVIKMVRKIHRDRQLVQALAGEGE